MKVYNSPSPVQVRSVSHSEVSRSARDLGQADSWSPSRDSSALSSAGQLVSDLRETARSEGRYGAVRPDVVAGIRREIAEGRFGGPEDVERAIDALLMEL